MKTLLSLTAVVLLAVFVVQPAVFAEEAALVEVGNKICPVSNEAVGTMGDVVQVEYDGKLYNLCCKMCAKTFKNEPEKYSKIAEAEASVHEEGSHAMSASEDGGHGDHAH